MYLPRHPHPNKSTPPNQPPEVNSRLPKPISQPPTPISHLAAHRIAQRQCWLGHRPKAGGLAHTGFLHAEGRSRSTLGSAPASARSLPRIA
eukprot:1478373-Rhodomonas_salina.2